MSKIAFLLVVILLAFVLPFSSPIFGTEENSDRIVNPGESIQLAINEASDGDTIHIVAGNYMENAIVNKSVALVGENIDETIIEGTGLSPTLLISKVDGVKVENLTLKNSYKTGGPVVAGVRIWDAKNIEITKCRIEQCEVGIELKNSTHSNITKNQIIGNDFYGIHLRDASSRNMIYGNLISSNLNGMWVPGSASRNNTIYHNNFVNNGHQIGGFGIGSSTWDDGYPSGGNYWDDYSGVDLYGGPGQNKTGSDGIGDESYMALDRYPIIGTIRFFNAGTWDEVSYYVAVASKSNITCFYFNPNEGPFVKFNVTDSEGYGVAAFCRVIIPQHLLWIDNLTEWAVEVDGNSVNVTMIQDDSYTYLYFTFDQVTKTIKIVGTYVIPEFSHFINLLITITLMFIILLRIRKKAL